MKNAQRVKVIAEAGVNHNGLLETAFQLVDAASEADADVVKFQAFIAEDLASTSAPLAKYQEKNSSADQTQIEMLKNLELKEDDYLAINERCKKRGIEFLATPFDLSSVDMLVNTLKITCLKLASGEITNGPLLLYTARTGKNIILSTGMSNIDETKKALMVLAFGLIDRDSTPSLTAFRRAYESDEGQHALHEHVSLLHCTSEYPAPYADMNLRAMDTLRESFGLPVGISDHSIGIAVPIASVARGAVIIEKHFTMDRNQPGPDHKASLEPGELKQMVQGIRQVEEALGRSKKSPTQSELGNIPVVRRSLVASRDIRKGEFFSEENITAKRPATGISPMHYWEWLGKVADRDYVKDETL